MTRVGANDVARVLTSMKGRRGLCSRLSALYAELDELTDSPARLGGMTVGGSSHTNSISDSTFRDSMKLINRSEKIETAIDAIEGAIGAVGSCLSSMKHGDVVADYYLDDSGEITWQALADESGVSFRTVINWRNSCLAKMAESSGSWLPSCEWLL